MCIDCAGAGWRCNHVRHNANHYARRCTYTGAALLLLIAKLLKHFDGLHCRHVVLGIAYFAQAKNVFAGCRSTKYLPALSEMREHMSTRERLPQLECGQSGCCCCISQVSALKYDQLNRLV